MELRVLLVSEKLLLMGSPRGYVLRLFVESQRVFDESVVVNVRDSCFAPVGPHSSNHQGWNDCIAMHF